MQAKEPNSSKAISLNNKPLFDDSVYLSGMLISRKHPPVIASAHIFIYLYESTHPVFHPIHLKMKRTYPALTGLPI